MMAPVNEKDPVAKAEAIEKLVKFLTPRRKLSRNNKAKEIVLECLEAGAIEEYYSVIDEIAPGFLEIQKENDSVAFVIISAVARNRRRFRELQRKRNKTDDEESQMSELQAILKADIEAAKKIFFVIKNVQPELLDQASPQHGSVASYARTLKKNFPEIAPLVQYIEELIPGPLVEVQRRAIVPPYLFLRSVAALP